MRLSARNQLTGTISDLTEGAVNASVKIDLGNGQTITSSITMESVRELDLKAGDKVRAVIKASDVMIDK